MRKAHLLSGALILSGMLAAGPAFAFTHHPSAPAERDQTRQLNLQQLQIAQGQLPANQQANIAAPNAMPEATPNAQSAPAMNVPASAPAANAQQPVTTNESSQSTAPAASTPERKPATSPSGY